MFKIFMEYFSVVWPSLILQEPEFYYCLIFQTIYVVLSLYQPQYSSGIG